MGGFGSVFACTADTINKKSDNNARMHHTILAKSVSAVAANPAVKSKKPRLSATW
jgi:hypothetical protein